MKSDKRADLVMLALGAVLVATPAPATTEKRDTTPAQRAQAVENDDFDEWGLLGLLGLAGLLGLRRRKEDHATTYTTTRDPRTGL